MSAASRVGARIAGGVELVGLLGQGPHGVVYEGRNEAGRRRAVKVLADAEGTSDASLASIVDRSRQLHCADRAFAQVLAVGRIDGGAPYLVSRVVAGSNLAAQLDAHGWLPLPDVALLLHAASPAVDSARASGCAHAQIHPGNIWRLPDGGI